MVKNEKYVQILTHVGSTTLVPHFAPLHKILSDKENGYLVRKLCWVLTIEGIDTYILQPRNPADFDALVEAIRPAPSPMDIDMGISGLLKKCRKLWEIDCTA